MKIRLALAGLVCIAVVVAFSLYGDESKQTVSGPPEATIAPTTEIEPSSAQVGSASEEDEREGDRRAKVEAEAVGADLPARSYRFLVLAADGSVVSAAVFQEVIDDEIVHLGLSNVDGRLDIPIVDRAIDLRVLAEGHELFEALVGENQFSSIDDLIEIRLAPASSLSGANLAGVVRWEDGTSVGAGVRVLMWNSGSLPKPDELNWLDERQNDQGTRLVSTNQSGEFLLTGLKPNAPYTLTAGGKGGICLKRLFVRGGDPVVELRIVPTYGVAIKLVTPNREAIRTPPMVYGAGSFWGSDADPGAYSVRSRSLLEVALALQQSGIGSDRSARERVLLYGHKSAVESVGPITFSTSVPGYADLKAKLWAKPLSDGLSVTELRLVQIAQEWGAVDVSCTGGVNSTGSDLDDERSIGSLTLVNVSTEEKVLIEPTDSMWNDVQRIDGIPCGTYEARLKLRDWAVINPRNDQPAKLVEVVSGGNAGQLSFSFEDAGAISITVRTETNAEYRGMLSVLLRDGTREADEPARASYVSFSRAPYYIPTITQGAYRISIAHMEGRHFTDLLKGDVSQVRTGEVTPVVLTR